MAREMLDEVGVSHNFWGEETQEIVHLSNKTQLRPNSDKNTHELWKGRPASVKNLKVFGSKCFIKRNDNNHGNFDSRTDEGILERYSTQSKGYKWYNKQTKKIEDCIDVIVDEIDSQPESSKRNMNSYGEENPYMRSTYIEETGLDSEGKEAGTTPRPNTPSRYVQKEHPESQILGDQRHGVQTKRKLVGNTSYENLALLSQIEPKNINKAIEGKFWVKAMN